jgi:hypothetical protein
MPSKTRLFLSCTLSCIVPQEVVPSAKFFPVEDYGSNTQQDMKLLSGNRNALSNSFFYQPLLLGRTSASASMAFSSSARTWSVMPACKRIHPAQYMLVGIAQIVFYLLLLSIAEHTGFDAAFAIAAIATVALISTYAGWVFGSRKYGLRASVIFALLYGLIYLLLGLDDQALLVGAVASFVAIAAVMYFTRRMDWYSSAGQSHLPLSKADPAGEPGSIGAT